MSNLRILGFRIPDVFGLNPSTNPIKLSEQSN